MSQYGSTNLQAQSTRLEVSTTGGVDSNWEFIPGVASFGATGGDAPSTPSPDLNDSHQIAGEPTPPNFEVAIPNWALAHITSTMLQTAFSSKTHLFFRWVQEGRLLQSIIGSGNTVAIAASGTATFAGTKPDFSRKGFGHGNAIQIGSSLYIVGDITAAGAVIIKPKPASAVAATATYHVVVPGAMRPEFSARVLNFGNEAVEQSSNISTTLTISCADLLRPPVPRPVAVPTS